MFISSFAAVIRHSLVLLAVLATVSSASASTIADPLGSAVSATAAAREIKISASTRVLNVTRHEVVRFVNAAGQSFTWRFHTLHHPIIDISKIAPANFSERTIQVYVGQAPEELS